MGHYKYSIMKSKYQKAKRELENKGIDFTKDVHSLNSSEEKLLKASAKEYGYKITSSGNSSLGCILHARYYVMLQKVK